MGTHALPDMYTISPLACGPRASGIHIRQTIHAHVMTITLIYEAYLIRDNIYRDRKR